MLADIDQLVAAGAEHITFGDPDFLNAPHHSMRVVRATARALPARHVRLHGQGRARARAPRPPARAARLGMPVHGVRLRVVERRDARSPRQGPHRSRRRASRSSCSARTASTSGRRSCRSRPGRLAPTSPTFSTSRTSTTWSAASIRCSTRSGCCSPRDRCCSTTPTSRRTSARGIRLDSRSNGRPAIPEMDALQRELAGAGRGERRARRGHHRDVRASARRRRPPAGRSHGLHHRSPAPHRELVLLRRAHRHATEGSDHDDRRAHQLQPADDRAVPRQRRQDGEPGP